MVVHHYCLIVEIIIHTLFVYWCFSVQSHLNFLIYFEFYYRSSEIYHPCDGLFTSYYEINLFFSYVAELSASNKYSRLLAFFFSF